MCSASATMSGQEDPKEPHLFACCWIQDQSLCFSFVLGQIGPGPASVGDECRHVVIGFVSRIFGVREKAYRPRPSPSRPALLQRRLKWEQQLSRLGSCIDLTDLRNDKNSFVPVINPHNSRRIVALTSFLRRCLRNRLGYKQKRQCKSGQELPRGSQGFTRVV